MDWQAVEARATVWIAVATVIAALGAIAAAIFAAIQIRSNASANRARLTFDFFDTDAVRRYTTLVNTFVKGSLSLAECKAIVQQKITTGDFTTEERESIEQDIVGLAGYAAVLYDKGVIDRDLFLARASEFIAVTFFIYEPALIMYLRTGLLHRDAVRMARAALAFRKTIPRDVDPYAELRTYIIPPDFGR